MAILQSHSKVADLAQASTLENQWGGFRWPAAIGVKTPMERGVLGPMSAVTRYAIYFRLQPLLVGLNESV